MNPSYQLTYLGCRGGLGSGCTTHICGGTIEGEKEIQQKVCNKCTSSRNAFSNLYGIKYQNIDDYLSKTNAEQIDKMLSAKDIDELLDLEISGIPVGKIATYDPCIELQSYSLETLKVTGTSFYRATLRSCITVFYGLEEFLKVNKVDIALIWNTMYSANRVAKEVIESYSGVVYNVHSWSNFSDQLARIEFHQGLSTEYQERKKKDFEKYTDIPITHEAINSTKKHIKSILDSRLVFTYSQKLNKTLDPSQFYSINGKSKVILACVSSNDERFAANISGAFNKQADDSLFQSQIEWISWLVSIARANPDITLIIRPHPRDFPNRRSKNLSPFGTWMKDQFKEAYDNIIIDWPENKVSIYSWAPVVSLVLYSWSSIAKEIALFGVPTLAYNTSLLTYTDKITYVAKDLNEYTQVIMNCSRLEFNLDYFIAAIRWYQYEHLLTTLILPSPLANNYNPETGSRLFLTTVKNKFYRKINLLLPIYALKLIKANCKDISRRIYKIIDGRLQEVPIELNDIPLMGLATKEDCLKMLRELTDLLPVTQVTSARHETLLKSLKVYCRT